MSPLDDSSVGSIESALRSGTIQRGQTTLCWVAGEREEVIRLIDLRTRLRGGTIRATARELSPGYWYGYTLEDNGNG